MNRPTLAMIAILSVSTPLLKASPPRPTVGLVLSGGGARGTAHIGVLQGLEQAGVPIDVVAGTSFGSMVGGLYAAGFSPADIALIARTVDWNEVFDETPSRRLVRADDKSRLDRRLLTLGLENLQVKLPTGLRAGQKIGQLLGRLTAHPVFQAENDFDRLSPRFRAVAADLLTGDAFVFERGPLWRAIRASIAVPAVFTPVRYQGRLLVDGGVADNLPVQTAREAGADLIIAVDVSSPLRVRESQFGSIADVLDQVIGFQIIRQTRQSREMADLVITPELGDFSAANFGEAAAKIAVGRKAFESRWDELKELLESRGVTLDRAPRERVFQGDEVDLSRFAWKDDALPIDTVALEGLARFEDAAREVTDIRKPGSVGEIDQQVSRLYALDRFQEVDFRLQKRGGRNVLTFEFQEAPPTRIGVGFRYDPEYSFTAAFEALGRGFPRSRAELEFRALLGNVKSVELELRDHSLLGSRLILAPRVYAFTHPRDFFPVRSDNSAPFDDRRAGFEFSLKSPLGNSALVAGGYRWESVEVTNGGGPAAMRNRQASLRLQSQYDSRDDFDFPARGLLAAARAEWMDPALGSETALTRFQATLQNIRSLRPGSVWSLDGTWGLLRGDRVPFYESFFTGGAHYLSFSSMRFPGLERDRIRSRHLVLLGTSFRQELKSFQLGLLKSIQLAGSYQAGLFNQENRLLQFRELLHGFGAGLYLDTRFLGPIRFDVGATSEGDYRTYFSIGHVF